MNDTIKNALKQRWFVLALKEDYPKTVEITKELDDIEMELKK